MSARSKEAITLKTAAVTRMVPLDQLVANTYNARRTFNEDSLHQLAENIRIHGILQPLLVREISPAALGNSTPPQYEIIAGERRMRAAKLTQVPAVPCRIVTGINDKDAKELSLVENLQREDLNPLERAAGFHALRTHGMSLRQIGERIGMSHSAVSNYMTLGTLSTATQTMILDGSLTITAAFEIAKWAKWPRYVEQYAQHINKHNWTVQQIKDHEPFFTAHSMFNNIDGCMRNVTIAKFDWKTICTACPFGAYHHPAERDHFCMGPEHFDSLQAAALKERQASTAAIVQEKTRISPEPNSPAPMLLADADYTTFRVCAKDGPPTCTDTCPCRHRGLDAMGEILPICTDPPRYTALDKPWRNRQNLIAMKTRQAHVANLQHAISHTTDISTLVHALSLHVAQTYRTIPPDTIEQLTPDQAIQVATSHVVASRLAWQDDGQDHVVRLLERKLTVPAIDMETVLQSVDAELAVNEKHGTATDLDAEATKDTAETITYVAEFDEYEDVDDVE